MNEQTIINFWVWFQSQGSQFDQWLKEHATESIACTMQPKLKELCPSIGWEMGPGNQNKHMLAFTLNGNRDNIVSINKILEFAPMLSNWEFYVGRPRRAYSNQLIFRNQSNQKISVNLDDWRYVLTSFDNGSFFDIAISADSKPTMDDSASQQVLRTVIQAILGELDTIKYIDRIAFVDYPNSDWEKRASLLRHLPSHLETLTNH